MNNRDRLYKPEEIKWDKIVSFSEGNVYLYDLLKYCYDKKIKTFACCKGHEASDESNGYVDLPYISFIVDGTHNDMFVYILNSFINEGYASNFFSFKLNYIKNNGTTLILYSNSINSEDVEIFFRLILIYIREFIQKKYENKHNKYNILFKFYDLIKNDNISIDGSNNSILIDVSEQRIVSLDKTPNNPNKGYYSVLVQKEKIPINNIDSLNEEDYENILEFNNSYSIQNNDLETFMENIIRIKNSKIR